MCVWVPSSPSIVAVLFSLLNFPFGFFCITTIHILSVSNNIIYDGMALHTHTHTHTFYIERFISVLLSFVDGVSSLFVVFVFFSRRSLLVIVVAVVIVVMNLSLRKYSHTPKSAHSLRSIVCSLDLFFRLVTFLVAFIFVQPMHMIVVLLWLLSATTEIKLFRIDQIERQLHAAAPSRQKENERKSNGFGRTWSIINRNEMKDKRQRI